jgi:penicillin-binding protein 1A
MPRQVAEDMNFLLSKVPEEGTGRRAALPGIRSAGKTGTTSAYRDAWYVGYTGNLTAAVWFGNDDYTSTADMTGGTLPAMAWNEIMSYAHVGLPIQTMPGVPAMDAPATSKVPAAQNRAPGFEILNPARPATLSRKTADVLTTLDTEFTTNKTRRAAENNQRADVPTPSYTGSAPASVAARASGESSRSR